MSAMTHPIELQPAASLILAREVSSGDLPQYLMVRRADTMVFAAGAMVFPGGRVDPGDRELANSIFGTRYDIDDGAARVAALREAMEECGLVFSDDGKPVADEVRRVVRQELRSGIPFGQIVGSHGLALNPASLTLFARWCPPIHEKLRRRFDTRFYIDVVRGDVGDLSADGEETLHFGWYSARDVLGMADVGEARIIFPTRRNLERLAQCDTVDALLAHARSYEPALISPWEEDRDGVPHLCIPENLGYPVTAEPIELARRG